MNNYIIPAEFYTFSDFIDPDLSRQKCGGDSGKLLVAERKPGVEDIYPAKLLVKHWYTNVACNEFMASRLAALLGVSASKVYLLSCPNWKKMGFATRYICGIEYIDGLRSFTDEELLLKNVSTFAAKVYGLSVLLNQSDGESMGVSDISEKLDRGFSYYAYDFGDTFSLSAFYTSKLLYCYRTSYIKKSIDLEVLVKTVKELPGANKLSDLQCRGFALKFYTYDRLKNLIDRMSIEMFLLEPLRIYWKSLQKVTGKKYIEEKWSAFIDPVRKFCTIDDKTVEELTTTVGRFYDYDENKIIAWDIAAGDILSEYYLNYIMKLKGFCIELMKDERVLAEIKNSRRITEKKLLYMPPIKP